MKLRLLLTFLLLLFVCGLGFANGIREEIAIQDAEELNKRGIEFYNQGDYQNAIECFLQAKDIYEKTVGKDHPDYATSLNNLGAQYNAIGDYENAKHYYLEALSIREHIFGKEHSSYATSLNNLGVLYRRMGDYENAKKSHLESLAIRERVLGKNHSGYADSLNNLGLLYVDLGDYDRGERYIFESLSIRERVLGKDHPSYIQSLNNMGILYMYMGDYYRAEQYSFESLVLFDKVLGKEHPDYASSLNNLGLLYDVMKDYKRAERYYLESLNINERVLGKEHPDYTNSLNNLGSLYLSMNDFKQAERYYLEAISIDMRVLGKNHPFYATSLNNLGMVYNNLREYDRAEQCFLESISIYERILGKNHPYYTTSLINLSMNYLDNNKYSQSLNKKIEDNRIRAGQIYHNFSFMSEQQREAYWKTASNSFESTYSISHHHPVPESSTLSYDNALFTKGLLLRTTNAVRDAIYSSGDQELIAQYEEMMRKRQQIANLQQSGGNENYIKQLEQEAEAMEKALNQASSAYAAANEDLQADLAINWQSIRDNLRPDEAAIEFVSFRLYDKKWTNRTLYAALVLKPGMKAPEWIPLCEETALVELFEKLKDETTQREKHPREQADILYNENGTALYATIWKPLEPVLQGVKTIYYSPSGLLHKVSFSAIPAGDKRLADVYGLNLVSSTREVVARNLTASNEAVRAIVYGGLLYDVDEEVMRQQAVAVAGTRSGTRDISFDTADTSDYLQTTTGSANWSYLHFTDTESKTVHNLLISQKIQADLFNGFRGNKESFKALDGKKNSVIHLATHGFFNQIEKTDYAERQRLEQMGQRQRTAESPLRRAGLVLSGANTYAKNPLPDTESGILLAEEVAGLNLLGAQLVVLSACETALGEVDNSEGVFGLQRAFKLAGAETLIMSLWKVDDEATAILIGNFYEGWLSGKTKQEAFKDAQRKLRTNPRHAHPFYWAAFVLMD